MTDFRFGYGEIGPVPKRLPRRAAFVGRVYWSWSPAHEREDFYYVSPTRLGGRRWLLWTRSPSDGGPHRWDEAVLGATEAAFAGVAEAARELLLRYWIWSVVTGKLDRPHEILSAGVLDGRELARMVDQVWDDPFLDPWSKLIPRFTRVPETSHLVCAYDVSVGADTVDEAAFLDRGASIDVLWIQSIEGCRAVAWHPRRDAQESARILLGAFWRTRRLFVEPTDFLRAGVIQRSDFQTLCNAIAAEGKANETAALRHGDAPIVRTARELGLNPRPAGHSPDAWMASCPGTSHWLMIGPITNEFGCGWCKRKGGPDELSKFAEERRHRRN